MQKANFITVEGVEGVGKTTALNYVKELLAQAHIDALFTREPGGTEIAEAIRRLILLEKYEEEMCGETELLLVFAARAQHLATVIKPAIAAGIWVVSDRFTDASYAYQGAGRGISVARIAEIETWVQGDFRPDLTLLLDAPVEIAMARANKRAALDRIEAETKDFFVRARAAYLARAEQEPERFRIVDASQDLLTVQAQIKNYVDGFVKGC